jgi:hypothetical protein
MKFIDVLTVILLIYQQNPLIRQNTCINLLKIPGMKNPYDCGVKLKNLFYKKDIKKPGILKLAYGARGFCCSEEDSIPS